MQKVILYQRQRKSYMGKFPPHHILSLLLLVCLSSLGILGAVCINDHDTSAAQDSSGVTMTINAESVLTLELMKDSIVLPITPNSSGQFGRTSLDIKVASNNATGYNLIMQANHDGNLTHEENHRTTAIKSIVGSYACPDSSESDTTCDNFPLNQWGYRPATEASYLSVADTTTQGSVIKATTNSLDTQETTTLYFGARLDNSIPKGTYDGVELTFVLITNPLPPNINSMLYMQDFATLSPDEKTDLLASMVEDEQYILKDKRDDKNYYVSKLQDGQVWMTQNLDFDITEETVSYLTSEYTNLTTIGTQPYITGYAKDPYTGIITWTPPSTAYTIMTGRDKTGTNGEINYDTNTGKWKDDDNAPYTVDIGKWYQTGTYFASSVCNDVGYSVGCNVLNSTLVNANNNASTPLSNYFKNNSTFETNGEHGAIGNYYNWTAAIASSTTNGITSGTYANSVCPAGWGLPANGEYGVLNTKYNNGSTTNDKATTNGLMGAPLYLVRGGGVYTVSSLSTTYEIGRNGLYWSSTAQNATNGYALNFRPGSVSPADYIYRSRGRSVRCRAL